MTKSRANHSGFFVASRRSTFASILYLCFFRLPVYPILSHGQAAPAAILSRKPLPHVLAAFAPLLSVVISPDCIGTQVLSLCGCAS